MSDPFSRTLNRNKKMHLRDDEKKQCDDVGTKTSAYSKGVNIFSSQSANGGPNGSGTASSSTIELKRRMMNFFERKSSTGSNNHQSHVNGINNSLRGGFNRQSRSSSNIEFVRHFYLYYILYSSNVFLR